MYRPPVCRLYANIPRPTSFSHHFPRSILTLSQTHGPTTPALLDLTVPQHFESIVNKYANQTAVVSRAQNQRLTYEELHSKSNALAKALQKHVGVGKGDRVAVSLGNNIEFATITYALFKLGAILVPLNPAFTETQVVAAINHLEASHLVIGLETNLSRRAPVSNTSLILSLLGSTENSSLTPSLSGVTIVNNTNHGATVLEHPMLYTFESLQSSESGTSPPDPGSPLQPNDAINIQFTSGTTSMPKAATLAHRSILNNGFSIGSRMLLTSKDVVVCPPPLFHCFGCILGYMATATHGSAIVFPTEAFDPVATLLAVQEEQATALYGVPTMFHAMLELIENGTVEYRGFENLRTGIAAGSSIPSALMEKLHRVLNLTELTICYGMTETSPVSCMTTTDDPIAMRLDSVGRLLPHVEAKVVSASDRNKIVPIGKRGELVVSGYCVMNGYWEDQAKTDEVLVEAEDGKRWMHTGDEAEMTPDGYVRITGRLKDLIIRGGENIHPLEVENCILQHPAVLDVSVVGVKDERYGETVAAFVIWKKGGSVYKKSAEHDTSKHAGEEIREWVRARMSRHLVPKHVFLVENFPKTASGKVQKFILREQADQMVRQKSNRASSERHHKHD